MYGERIKILRKNAGLNQADLAEKIGVSRPNISFWENSEFPPLEAITKVCGALGIETWKFFINEDVLANITNIPPDYLMLLEDIMTLDVEDRSDLLEIFKTIVKKFRKTSPVNVAGEKIYSGQGRNLNLDILEIKPALPAGADQYNADTKNNTELDNYFNSIAWLKH